MKETGVVRRIDLNGRLMLPVEIRQQFDLKDGDVVEFFTDNDKIIFRKFQISCVFCGSNAGITKFKGKAICYKCRIAMENYVV